MWTREELQRRIANTGIKGKCWGRFGQEIVKEIEQTLGVEMNVSLRAFGENVGNLIVGPFSLVVCGSEDGALSCATETAAIRHSEKPYTSKLVKIMDHAGESYFAVSGSDSILCYDTLNITKGMETQSFTSLAQFLDWLLEEAKR